MSLKEDAWSAITNAPGTAGTSFVLQSGRGPAFPPATVGYFARVYLLADPGYNERVYVSGRSSDTLTPVVRNYDGRGAQNITASGWAIEAVHDLGAIDTAGFFLNHANDAAPFVVFAPSTQPAKLLQAGDMLRHQFAMNWVNGLGAPHTFSVSLGFGKSGVAQQIYHNTGGVVPANTTYIAHHEVTIYIVSTASQLVVSKVTIYNATTAALFGIFIVGANGTFDTNANDWHMLHTGLMDVASASVVLQGLNVSTELVRARGS